MKCYYIASVNGNTVFEPREAPVPHPGKGELLVKVRAASLNRRGEKYVESEAQLGKVVVTIP